MKSRNASCQVPKGYRKAKEPETKGVLPKATVPSRPGREVKQYGR
jgi:hypothetical protein